MDDYRRALLGDREAAARLAKASRVVPCPYCNGTQVAIRGGLYTQMRCEKCGTRGPLADSAFEAAHRCTACRRRCPGEAWAVD